MSSRTPRRRYLLYAYHDYSFPVLGPVRDAIAERGDEVAWFAHGKARPDRYLESTDRQCESVGAVMDYDPFAVITPNNTLPHFFPGIKTQIFHGFNARKRTDGDLDSHFAIRGFFDLYCTQGPSTTRVFEELSRHHQYFAVTETGWPKIDTLVDQPVYENPNGRPTIILTSTFSKKLTCAPHLLPTIKELVARNDMDWLVQFHPKMSPAISEQYKAIQADNYQLIETANVMPYLAKADVMVSDTSSILQEFMQLTRPVVTLRNRTPGPWLIDIQEPEELQSAIDQALTRPPRLIEEIKAYNAQLHPYTDGRSAERVIDAVEDFAASDNKPKKRKPPNLLRKFKMRKELSYWRP